MGRKRETTVKYRISFREIRRSDIKGECPFLPEADEFETHLHAITQDIIGLLGVTEVASHEKNILVVATQGVDLQTLKAEIKPFLQHHFQYFRISRIETF